MTSTFNDAVVVVVVVRQTPHTQENHAIRSSTDLDAVPVAISILTSMLMAKPGINAAWRTISNRRATQLTHE